MTLPPRKIKNTIGKILVFTIEVNPSKTSLGGRDPKWVSDSQDTSQNMMPKLLPLRYSTIWLARALPEDGEVVTLEIDPQFAEVIQCIKHMSLTRWLCKNPGCPRQL